MISLNTSNIPATIEDALKFKDYSTGNIVDDTLQLKDHEILVNVSKSEFYTAMKTSTNDITVTEQIQTVIDELITEGVIQLANVATTKINISSVENIGDKYSTFKISYNSAVTPNTLSIDKGSWTDTTIQEYLGIRPCILNNDGEVIKYLDINNYNKYRYPSSDTWYTDGDCSTNITGQNIMIEIPKIYKKKFVKDGYIYTSLTKDAPISPTSSWTVHPAFYSEREGGRVYADYIYIATYPSTLNTGTNGKIQACSRKSNSGTVTNTDVTSLKLLEYINNIGEGFTPLTNSKLSLLQDIYIIMAGTITMFDNAMMHAGSIDDLDWTITGGLFSTSLSTTKGPQVKWLGIANPFNFPCMVSGLVLKLNSAKTRGSLFVAEHGPYPNTDAELKVIIDGMYDNFINTTINTINCLSGSNKTTISDISITEDGSNILYASVDTYNSTAIYNGKFVQYISTEDNDSPKVFYFGADSNQPYSLKYLSPLETVSNPRTLICYS